MNVSIASPTVSGSPRGVFSPDADREKIDEDDIMEAARRQLGLESFDQVRFAILERTGGISIIPWGTGATRAR